MMVGVEFDGELALLVERFDSLHLMRLAGNPEVARAHLVIGDDGYYDRVFEYCATAGGLSEQAVASRLTEQLMVTFQALPIRPNTQALAAYQEFVSVGGRFVLALEPGQSKKPHYFSHYEPPQTRLN